MLFHNEVGSYKNLLRIAFQPMNQIPTLQSHDHGRRRGKIVSTRKAIQQATVKDREDIMRFCYKTMTRI
jgi:hypothetical protein